MARRRISPGLVAVLAMAASLVLCTSARAACETEAATVLAYRDKVSAATKQVRAWSDAADRWDMQYDILHMRLIFVAAAEELARERHDADPKGFLKDSPTSLEFDAAVHDAQEAMGATLQAHDEMRNAARRGQQALLIEAILRDALSTAQADLAACTQRDQAATAAAAAAAKPVCEVNRPLLSAGDNADATMRVTSNRPCTCGFLRSDSSLEVAAPAQHGAASATSDSCTYQSQAGYVGEDSFTLIRSWPEGGVASVTFTVTVVP